MAKNARSQGQRGRLSSAGGHVSLPSAFQLAAEGLSALTRQGQRLKAEGEHQKALAALADNQVSGRLQDARLATPRDMVAAGLSVERRGVYCGVIDGQSVFLTNDRHIMWLGGSAIGKSSRAAMPMIISLGLAGESTVAFDFKTELSWCTSEGRTAIDGDAALHFAPFGSSWAASIAINPLDDVIDRAQRGLPIADLVRQKSTLLFPKLEEMGVNKWIGDSAQQVFFALTCHYGELEPEKCWLGHLSDFGSLAMAEIIAELVLIARHSPAGDGLAGQLARNALRDFGVEIAKDGASQPTEKGRDCFNYIMKEYSDRLSPFARGGAVRQHLQRTSFDLAQLKLKARALYINIPPMYLKSHSALVSVLTQYMIDRVATSPGGVRVAFLLDEFGLLPSIPNMMTALRLYRDYGVRLIVFGQDVASFDAYKNESGYEAFKASSLSIVSGQNDGRVLRDLQDQGGYRADLVGTYSAQPGATYDQGSLGMNEQLSPLLPISKLRQIGLGRCIWDVQGMPLAIADLPLFKALPWAASYIVDKKKHPVPFCEY